jgi:glucose-6-phosphate-specific signal transduction histidine kinase
MQGELADALQENRRLSQRSIQVQEEERRHLARELHDELGQSLNAIKVDAVNIRDRSQPETDVRQSAQAIIDVSSQVYEVVRGLMQRLRPVALDELGLRSAVQYSVDQWQRRHPGVQCIFDVDGDIDNLGEELNITLYRLVQECLTNVAKHASATRVSVEIQRTGAELGVTFRDDGRGFDPGQRNRGLGLVGLRERVEALGGKFTLESVPGHGASIGAQILLREVP